MQDSCSCWPWWLASGLGIGGLDWWEKGSIDFGFSRVEISRILLMFLVVLIVYSVADFLPFFPQEKDKGYIKWLFAGVVAVLSFLFVDGADIQLILTNYEALGIMLTSIIPLVVILAFTFKMRTGDNKKYANIINTPLIIGFGIYTLIKWWSFDSTSVLRSIYLWTLFFTIAFLFFNKSLFKWVEKEKLNTELDMAEHSSRKIRKEREMTREEFKDRVK